MIGVTRDTFRNDLTRRTVTGDAVRFRRHQYVGRLPALRGVMTDVAIERFLRVRIGFELAL